MSKKKKREYLIINVTLADIRNGIPGESDSCAIALAVNRAVREMGFKDINKVNVDDERGVQVNATQVRSKSISCQLDIEHCNKQISKFVKDFDGDEDMLPAIPPKQVKPTTFRIPL